MRGGKMLLHPAAPRGWIDWVVRSSFPSLDLLFYLCQSEGVASPKDNLAEKQKRRSTPDVGVLRLGNKF